MKLWLQTCKDIFTKIDNTWCFADASSRNVEDPVKHIRMPIVHPDSAMQLSIISSISWGILTTWSEHCSKSCCPSAPIYPNWEKTLWPQARLWKLVHTKMVNESLHRAQNAFNHPWLSNVAIARVSVMYSGGHSNQATNQAVLTWEAGPIPAGPVSQSWILA